MPLRATLRPMSLCLTIDSWNILGEEALRIRHEVFVDEQGVPVELELDEWDPVADHALLRADGTPIATGRLLPNGRIGRMAVRRNWRRRGAGSAILTGLVKHATTRGMPLVRLHAQLHAVAFYERHGFVPEGSPFMEAGIEHISMFRHLPPAD